VKGETGEWSTLHTTSEHDVATITTPDAYTSAASSRLNWRPCRFKWTRPFRRKTKSGFCACAITLQTQSTQNPRCCACFSFSPPKINFKIFSKSQTSKRDQNSFVIFANQTQNCSECSASFLYCILPTVYFLLPYFLLYQTITLLPARLYQKDVRPLPGNLQSSELLWLSAPFLFLHYFFGLSMDMPGQALRDPGGWGSQYFKTIRTHVASLSVLHTCRLFLQVIFLVLISVRGWADPMLILRPEGLIQRKISMTPSGIEPATFRLVTQCLIQLRHSVSPVFLFSLQMSTGVLYSYQGEDNMQANTLFKISTLVVWKYVHFTGVQFSSLVFDTPTSSTLPRDVFVGRRIIHR